MDLQDQLRAEVNVREIRVDGVRHLSIPSDLLFGSIRGMRAFGNEIPNALRRRHHAVDMARGLGALDERTVAQRLEHLRRLLLEECLFASVFADEPNALQQSLVERLPG